MKHIIDLLKSKLKDIYQRIRVGVDVRILPVVKKSSLLSSLYYALLSNSFENECRSVICGRANYSGLNRSPRGNEYLLRRNIHRLEKGLLMRPRRDVFGLDYIEETVDAYEKNLHAFEACRIEEIPEHLKWASDVLHEYFEPVTGHSNIDSLKKRFACLYCFNEDCELKHIPYKRDASISMPVSYENLFVLSKQRKSVRFFIRKTVPRKLIDNAVKVAAQSPSACNRQPFELRIFDDPQYVKQVVSIPMGTSGFGHNIPAVAVIIGNLSAFFDERDRHLIYIDASLAAMSFMYALETQGLSSCCINWPDIKEKEVEMSRILNLAPYERPVLLIALGYPDPNGQVAYSPRKAVDELRRYNFE